MSPQAIDTNTTGEDLLETPIAVIDHMFELVFPRGKILVPLAGKGAIADQLPVNPRDVHCVESNPRRAEELGEKDYLVFNTDFMTFEPKVRYDTIFMSLPIENTLAFDYLCRAMKMLADGGELVAVMRLSAFSGSDHKASEFQQWLRGVHAYIEKLPEKHIYGNGADGDTHIVVIRNG